ncbi:YggS family pyridoxal phosphate-dependent enzyme [Cellulomonas sp. KRMCY2]|uniref:YggS family pyridoxal phosphate-dependent enzyme n=1 Tax=Cellulomonas sp. KRMCY2 TaxID=1304865 RepID=UPI00045E852D|nr:YggS family pyridoxal phosphate-dependent enzyme [Cellulomonas sp. KRMCY2]
MSEDAAIAARLSTVRARVARAEQTAGRPPGEVRLMLATKTQSAAVIRAALLADTVACVASGLVPVLLGENRVQEAVTTATGLADLHPQIHLIGPLQSNKINHALRAVDCVQTVATLDLAGRLSLRCATTDRVLDVMVQVNVSGEPTKSGVPPEAAVDLATQVAALPGLQLVGFMTIGANTRDTGLVLAGFSRLREVRDELVASDAPGAATARELSMGMSGDLEDAIAEGATIVRVGSAVFGSRPPA